MHLNKCPQKDKDTSDIPKPQYLKLSPATVEYHQIMTLSQELGCSWQDIAREALRKYLREFHPKKV